MSDTHGAPAPASSAASPAPGSSQSEVPINPNPVNAPAPLGSSAPQAPERAREVIAKAFERARVERKGPAEAKAGHNQPPEPTEKEKPAKAAEPPLDLKKRPTDQEAASATPPTRERGDGGRFKPAAGTDAAKGASPPAKAPPVTPLPDNAPYREPLQRMSERARTEWAAAPESVRGEVHRMHKEFSDAYGKFKSDHDTMNTVRPYHDLAKSQGTTLQKALTNYVGIEKKLREDPVGGLDVIVNNLNLRTSDGRKLGLTDIAYHVLSQTPEQHQLSQQQNQSQALSQQLAEIRQAQRELAKQQQQMQYDQRFRQKRGEVNRFADTHPRLDELGDIIERELALGFDLPTAYQRANLLRPTTNLATNPGGSDPRPTPAAQTRNSDRSISGAPAGGVANGASRPGKKADRRGSIVNAMKRASSAL